MLKFTKKRRIKKDKGKNINYRHKKENKEGQWRKYIIQAYRGTLAEKIQYKQYRDDREEQSRKYTIKTYRVNKLDNSGNTQYKRSELQLRNNGVDL